MHYHEYNVNNIKQKAYQWDYASVLALLKGKVSFFKALYVLSFKCSLLKLGVRPYTAWHAKVLTNYSHGKGKLR
jgi:hypothetical protein